MFSFKFLSVPFAFTNVADEFDHDPCIIFRMLNSVMVDQVTDRLDLILLLLIQQKALEAAMNDINSSFGKGSVTRLGSAGGALVYVFSFIKTKFYNSSLACVELFFFFFFMRPACGILTIA
jgi:hypothetical protein